MRELVTKLRIDANVDAALAGLRQISQQYDQTRKNLTAQGAKIAALEAAERSAETAGKAVDEARRKIEFFRRSAEIAGPTGMKEFAKDIERAKNEAVKANNEMVRQQSLAAKLRGELAAAGVDTRRLAAEQARLAQEMQRVDASQAKLRLQAGRIAASQSVFQDATNLLGFRDHASINAEIAKTTAAYQTLRTSGKLSQAELAQAAALTRQRIAELNQQMGTNVATAGGMAGAYGTLRTAFFAFQALLAGNAVIKAVDDMRTLEARVNLVSASQSQAGRAMAGVAKIANEAQAPINQVGAAYVKYAGAVRTLGGTQEQSLALTRAVALGLRVSGATAQEAGAAMYQLGQAFQKGKLSGDEFVTLMESGGKLMDYLALGMGKTKAELIEMSAAGELTADKMLEAWTKALPQIEKDAAAIPDTVGGAMTYLGSSFKQFASDSEVLKGGLNSLAVGIKFVGDHMDAIAGVAAVAGMAALVANWGKLRTAILAAAAAMRIFAVSNPVLLALTLIAAAGVAAYDAIAGKAKETTEKEKQAAQEVGDKRKELEDRYANLLARREQLEKQAAESAKAVQKDILEAQKKSIGEQIADAERLRDALVKAYDDAGEQAKAYRDKAQDIRARMRARNYDDSESGQSMAQSDLQAAERKLNELYNNNAPVEQVQRQAEAMRTLAGYIKDAAVARRALDRADVVEASALERGAAEEATRQKQLGEQTKENESLLEEFKTSLAEVEAKLKEITDGAKQVKIEADQAALEKVKSDIEAVRAQLASLPDSKTVNINTVTNGSTVNTGGASGSYAAGGPITGPGPVGVDSQLIMAAPGEHMFTAREVEAAGGHDAIYRIRRALLSGALKGYAQGGPIAAQSTVLRAVSALPDIKTIRPTSQDWPNLGRIDLSLGDMGSYPVYAEPDVASALASVVRQAARKIGRR